MTKIAFNNLDTAASYGKLKEICSKLSDLRNLLNKERISKYHTKAGGGLVYNFAAKKVNDDVLGALQGLAEEQQLIEKYKELLNGQIINTGEKRMVLHHLVRGQLGKDVAQDGTKLRDFYVTQQKNIYDFAAQIHSGQIKGCTGKKFDTVVQVGIGGSDLGPRALYLSLKNYVQQNGILYMQAFFISNVDPDDANEILAKIDLETTLFILVSKSGTTQETLTNETIVRQRMKDKGLDPNEHFVAITSETSPLAKSVNFIKSFFMNDYIGGRYSATSAVGGAILTLAFGKDVFCRVLTGAHEADKFALNKDILQNASLLDALIGVMERNFLGYASTAVLPYSQALSRFPAHLQQLDMESNGKSVNREGQVINYATGPVILGEPGTNGQHSFYQLLHQGTDIIPLQFIGFKKAQYKYDLEVQSSTSQAKLNANLVAQIVAFALGKADANPNKSFVGNRPSSLLYADQLTPEALGALLAHYENKVMFQGFIWNVNSFDQEGVQLGKILASQVLQGSGAMSPVLKTYWELMR